MNFQDAQTNIYFKEKSSFFLCVYSLIFMGSGVQYAFLDFLKRFI